MKILAIFTCCVMASTASHAASLEWTFDNRLNFSDGSFLSGSFLYDADTNATDFSNLTFACDNVCAGNVNNLSGQVEDGETGTELFLFGLAGNDESIEINLLFDGYLTNLGGQVSLDLFGGGVPIQVQNREDDGFADATNATTISASPVPVPAAAWLFGSALIGLAGIKRKK